MFAIIRIKGTAGLSREVRDTLKMLRLYAPNNCVLAPETPDYKGMLKKVKDVVTFGEIDKKILVEMLKKRLRGKNNRRIDENGLRKITGFSYEEFADALMQEKVKLKDFNELQPYFRLTPPSKGFKSTKEHYPKGDLGYRGSAINSLLERMI